MFFPIGFGFSSGYMLYFFIIPLILGGLASAGAKARLSKYSKISISNGKSGAQSASEMLSFHNVYSVKFMRGYSGQDFFDPRSNSITLSPEYFSNNSIAACAVACHEAGHACQYAQGYMPIKFRNAIVPVVNFASNAWLFILLIGIFIRMSGLIYVGVAVFALTLLFQVATLPVEFNASSRAIAYLETQNLSNEELNACKKILRSCAMTYVVSTLISALQLLYVLARTRED